VWNLRWAATLRGESGRPGRLAFCSCLIPPESWRSYCRSNPRRTALRGFAISRGTGPDRLVVTNTCLHAPWHCIARLLLGPPETRPKLALLSAVGFVVVTPLRKTETYAEDSALIVDDKVSQLDIAMKKASPVDRLQWSSGAFQQPAVATLKRTALNPRNDHSIGGVRVGAVRQQPGHRRVPQRAQHHQRSCLVDEKPHLSRRSAHVERLHGDCFPTEPTENLKKVGRRSGPEESQVLQTLHRWESCTIEQVRGRCGSCQGMGSRASGDIKPCNSHLYKVCTRMYSSRLFCSTGLMDLVVILTASKPCMVLQPALQPLCQTPRRRQNASGKIGLRNDESTLRQPFSIDHFSVPFPSERTSRELQTAQGEVSRCACFHILHARLPRMTPSSN
jgi:hypothetical protein